MRVFILGLDGATWHILSQLFDEGAMPCLWQLIVNGASGTLRSTQPPITPTAWTSFQTGTQPGRHGVYGFQQIKRTGAGLQFEVVDATSIRAPTLWDHLRSTGRSVGIVNLPLTYPPSPVPGVLVTGFPTPSQGSTFTYPKGLKEEILEAVPTYRVPTVEFGGAVPDHRIPDYVDWLTRLAVSRADGARYLMRKCPWDVFVLQFQETDLLQHPLWHHLDPNHPASPGSRHPQITRFFQQLDDLVADLTQELGDDDLCLIVSDHGFQGMQRAFFPNRWLVQSGWLHFRDRGRSAGARLMNAVKHLDVWGLRHRMLSKSKRQKLKQVWSQLTYDWHRSAAYAEAYQTGFGIYLLDHAVRDELRASLEALRDPEDGSRVVRGLMTADEVYGADRQEGAPDLIVELEQGFGALPERQGQGASFRACQPGREYQVGIHHPDGILIATGPEVTSRNDLAAQLVDVAPTVLYALDERVPTSMDGSVITDLFNLNHLQRRPIRYQSDSDSSLPERSMGGPLSTEEQEQVEQHLRDLGYLS